MNACPTVEMYQKTIGYIIEGQSFDIFSIGKFEAFSPFVSVIYPIYSPLFLFSSPHLLVNPAYTGINGLFVQTNK